MSRSMFLAALIPLALAGGVAQSPSGVQGLTPVGDSWVTYHGDPSARHFSSLKQITTQNVRGLSLAWTYRANTAVQGAVTGGPPAAEAPGPGRGGAGPPGGGGPARGPDIKAIPLAVDGVLYLSTPTHAWAIDARTGDEIWHYAW